MNNQKELLKNTIIIFVGRFCTQFISFLLLPIYTSYLIPYDYGIIDLIQTYITLFIPVIALRLDSAVFRYLLDERDNEEKKKIIISTSIISLVIQIIFFTIAYLLVGIWVNITYYWLIIVNIIFMTLTSVLLQVSRGIGDNIGYSLASCVSGFVTILFNIVLVVILKLGGTGVLTATAIANFMCCLTLFFRNKLYRYLKLGLFKLAELKKMLKYSIPMIFDGLSWWVISVSDRTIITAFIDASANGIYAVSSKFSNILSSLYSVINMSWQESASLHINDADRDQFFSKTINNILKIFTYLCMGIIVCIPILFEVLIGSDYKEAKLYIPIILLANIFNVLGGMFGGIYISKKMTKQVAQTTFISAIINVVLNLIFVKQFGLYAAAFSTLIAYLVIFVYRYLDTKKIVVITFDTKMIVKLAMLFILSTILYYIGLWYLDILNFIIIVILAFCDNKEIIDIGLKTIKNKLKGKKND